MADVTSEVRAAGGVVWRRHGSLPLEVLLIHRPKYDDWSLPKGKAEGDETDEQTARREVAEETGLDLDLGTELARIRYTDHLGRSKTVRYWAMEAGGDDGNGWRPNDEVDELEWMPLADARSRISYARDVAVLDAFEAAGLAD